MKAQVISFHCVLKTKLGRVISSTSNYDVLTLPTEGKDQMLQGLVDGLQNLKGGEKRKIAVSAEQAYGFYDPNKVLVCPRESLDVHRLAVGDKVRAKFRGNLTMFRVTDVSGDEITLDSNHPLAGEDLVFEIEALDVREARPEDLEGMNPALH